MHSKNICMVFVMLCLSIGEARTVGNFTSDAPSLNTTVCQQDCLEEGHSCDCYRDGWIACDKRNLTKIPKIPECARMVALDQNAITKIEPSSFHANSNVKILDISRNKIKELGSGVFRHLTVLQVLVLHDNSIVVINECAFAGLSQLTSLDLSVNQITSLSENVFDDNAELQELAVYRNNISELQTRWFENKPQLKSVFLENNSWNCTCRLWDSYQFVLNQTNLTVICDDVLGKDINSMCITCYIPASFNNISLYNLTRENFPSCSDGRQTSTDGSGESNTTGMLGCNVIVNQTSSDAISTREISMSTTFAKTTAVLGRDISTDSDLVEILATRDHDYTSDFSEKFTDQYQYTTVNGRTSRPLNISVNTVTKRAQGKKIEWWLALIIILVTLALLGMLGLAMWCGRKKEKRLTRIKFHSEMSCASRDYIVVHQQRAES